MTWQSLLGHGTSTAYMPDVSCQSFRTISKGPAWAQRMSGCKSGRSSLRAPAGAQSLITCDDCSQPPLSAHGWQHALPRLIPPSAAHHRQDTLQLLSSDAPWGADSMVLGLALAGVYQSNVPGGGVLY